LNELLSGDCSLRSAIKTHFPEFHYHAQLTRPDTQNVSLASFRSHEVFYYTKPLQGDNELWVVDKSTAKVVIKRRTRKSDWICVADMPEINLQGYRYSRSLVDTIFKYVNKRFLCRHPVAVFHVNASNSFAVWDLSQSGHPRHIGFDIQLPAQEPSYRVLSYTTSSKWIIAIHQAEGTYYVYVDFPSKLKNSSIPCECNIPGTRKCHEELYKLKASKSLLLPKTFVYDVGDRFIVQRGCFVPAFWGPYTKVYLYDCWKTNEETKQSGFLKRCEKYIQSIKIRS
jgi:hypothetical protein